MGLFDLQQWPFGLLIAVYAAAAALIWISGGKASTYADEVSKRTGIGGSVVGMVMLGGMTSLPEIATSATAAVAGSARLAVSNLLGGVAFQVVVLAVVDAFIGNKALTSTVPNPSLLLQAIACILLLSLAAGGIITGEFDLIGVGAWATGMLLGYAASIVFVRGQERDESWFPSDRADRSNRTGGQAAKQNGRSDKGSGKGKQVDSRLIVAIGIAAAVILAAGYVLTRTAEEIATRTGLETAVAGMTLLAIATSLPELSTAISAVKIGRNDIAIGDVLGGNLFDLMLIFFVDLLFIGPPVLSQVGPAEGFAAILGVILTSIVLVGMIERRNRTLFRMGYDSLLVLLCYAGGIALIFSAAGTGQS